MRVPAKLRAAMKRYYDNRRKARETKWDKEADLEHIWSCLPKNCIYAEASAGTFFLTWKRPRLHATIHTERHYWTGKVFARKVKGVWKRVAKDYR